MEDNDKNNNKKDDNNDSKDATMTILEHLEELRGRLIKIFIAVALGFAVCYQFARLIFEFLMQPLAEVLPEGTSLIFTNLTEAFFTYIKVGFLGGFFLTSPYIIYQIWAFVSPGLYKKEKKTLIPVAFISAIFFVGGACFGYFIVFPWGFKFLIGNFATELIKPMPKMKEYFSLATKMLIAFGAIFELPLVVLILSRFGLVTDKLMRKYRRYALLFTFILAAALTPPDVITQAMMAGPLIILYEASIWVAYFFGKKRVEPEEDDDEDKEVTKGKDEKGDKDKED